MPLFKLGDIVLFETTLCHGGHKKFLGEIVVESENKLDKLGVYAVKQIDEPGKIKLSFANTSNIRVFDASFKSRLDNDHYYDNKYIDNLLGENIYYWLWDADVSLVKSTHSSSGQVIIKAGNVTTINMPNFCSPAVIDPTDSPYDFKIILDTSGNGNDLKQGSSEEQDRGGLKYL